MDNNNLLISLHKWSGRQDENFITEVLVYLLNFGSSTLMYVT